MQDEDKTKEQLIAELRALRQRLAESEKDKTARRQAEESLLESESKFKSVAEQALAGIYILQDGVFKYVNAKFAQMFGYTVEECVNLPFKNLVYPADLSTVEEQVRRRTSGKAQFVHYAFRGLKKNGQVFHVEVYGAVSVHKGKPAGTGTILDITERKRAEDELRHSEERFSRFFRTSPAGTSISLLSNGRFADVNDAFLGLIGYTREEVIGQNPLKLEIWVVPEDRAKAIEMLQEQGGIKDFETRFRRKSGEIIEVLVSGEVIDLAGERYILGLTLDITRRKRAEELARLRLALFEFSSSHSLEELLKKTLDEVGALTNSPIGFYHFVESDQKTLSLHAWSTRTVREFCRADVKSVHYPIDRAGVWVDCIRRRMPVIHNDYSALPHRKGMPEGHVPVVRELVVPVMRSGRIVAVLGIGNKPANYTKEDLEIASSLAEVAYEISERKRAEEKLLFRNLLLSTEQEASIDGILVVDERNRILSSNRRFVEMWGLPPKLVEDEVDEPVLQFVVAQMADPGSFLQRVRHIYEHREETFLDELFLADGRVFDRYSAPMFGPDDRYYGRVWYFRDISERKRTQEALRKSEERFALAMEATKDGLWDWNLNTGIVYYSPGYAAMLGFAPGEIPAHAGSWADRIHPEDRDEALRANMDCIENGRGDFEVEFRMQAKNGEWRWILGRGKAVGRDGNGRASRVVGTHTDITERKWAEEERRRLEERLQRAEKMEALGTLAGGVAHDLNNVLGIVVGYSELLLYDLDRSSPARLKAGEILKGGQRASSIVQDLLTLARRGVSNREVLNLNNIVMECRNSPEFARVCSYHPNIRISVDLEAHLLNISGSAVHLGKSLMNLVSNAAEAMPEGGVVTIKTWNQYLDKPVSGYDEVQEGDYVVLSVSDTGEGIPARDLKRIFEPFYTKKVMGRSGTGLGLAVIWGTVKDHLGYLNVESQEGNGAAFTLYFPVTREVISREQVSISAAEYMGNGELILIVDDVKEQRDLAGTMLDKLDYTVAATVSSGEEAVDYLKRNAVDLVVLDMIMDPGMDGLDTYAKILEINPRQRAIIVSGFSETERVNKAQALGAGAYVKKPYVVETLGLAVRKELDRRA